MVFISEKNEWVKKLPYFLSHYIEGRHHYFNSYDYYLSLYLIHLSFILMTSKLEKYFYGHIDVWRNIKNIVLNLDEKFFWMYHFK